MGQRAQAGKLKSVMRGGRMSYWESAVREGMQRVRSTQAELTATPAGSGMGVSLLWKETWGAALGVEFVRRRWRRSWRRARERVPPAESPAKTMFRAETGG